MHTSSSRGHAVILQPACSVAQVRRCNARQLERDMLSPEEYGGLLTCNVVPL